MSRTGWIVAVALGAAAISTTPGFGQDAPSGVDRLYVMNCGEGHAADQSRWSPGVNVGKPLDISNNCYLIHHRDGYLLWETGVPDAVAERPDGVPGANGAPSWRRPRTLADQLAGIGVGPSDIRYVAVSHTHPDHVGNVEFVPNAMLLIQKTEYEWVPPLGYARFAPAHPVMKLEGDHDVFGDGSVTIISTPGHTPGHQSLLVHLAETGWVVLSGDAVHFKENWDNRRVPGPNFNKDQTLASMQRIADLMAEHHAQLWINHDKPQSDAQRHAPEFYR